MIDVNIDRNIIKRIKEEKQKVTFEFFFCINPSIEFNYNVVYVFFFLILAKLMIFLIMSTFVMSKL